MNQTRVEPDLETKLKRLRLRPEATDRDTIVLKRVPADQRYFNKARTNLLIKRASEAMPCIVCVDEDLEYSGPDPALAAAFAAAPTQQGWRVLTFAGRLHGDLTAALGHALGFLVADEANHQKTSISPYAQGKKLLSVWAENLTEAVAGRQHPTLCRDEELERAAACTLQWQGHLPLVLGEAGTGKTNFLHGVAKTLVPRGRTVLTVNMGTIMAGTLFESEREALLASLLREARDSTIVLALDQAEWAIIGVPRGPVLLRDALDHGVRMIAACARDHESRFSVVPLASRLAVVQLNELGPADTRRVLENLRTEIATHHSVRIAMDIEQAVVARSLSMDGFLPGKAVSLMDAAAARASLAGNAAVDLTDVYLAASRMATQD